MDVQMLGFTSGFLAVPGLHLVGKLLGDATPPSRVSVLWLGRCESPQALVSRFLLVLRDCKENWNKSGKGVGSRSLALPCLVAVQDGCSRNVALGPSRRWPGSIFPPPVKLAASLAVNPKHSHSLPSPCLVFQWLSFIEQFFIGFIMPVVKASSCLNLLSCFLIFSSVFSVFFTTKSTQPPISLTPRAS